jgi:hypothetical protein
MCRAIIEAARQADRPVLVDPARTPEWEKYRRASLATPNWAELEIAAGRGLKREELTQAAGELARRLQIEALVVTLGRDGALLVQPDRHQHFPTIPRAVYDNTGAGDAVLAMLAVARAAGATIDQAIRLANIAGGLEVSKFGCVPITREEVLREGPRRTAPRPRQAPHAGRTEGRAHRAATAWRNHRLHQRLLRPLAPRARGAAGAGQDPRQRAGRRPEQRRINPAAGKGKGPTHSHAGRSRPDARRAGGRGLRGAFRRAGPRSAH